MERADAFSIEISGIDSEHITSEIDPKTGETNHLLMQALRKVGSANNPSECFQPLYAWRALRPNI